MIRSSQFLSAVHAGVPSPEGNPKVKSLYGGGCPIDVYGAGGNQRLIPVAPWSYLRLAILMDQTAVLNLSFRDGKGNLMPPKAQAVDTLTIAAGNAGNGETLVVAGVTYTWETTLTNVDGNVLIGADNIQSAYNLIAAITLGETPAGLGAGDVYAALTTLNDFATAETVPGTANAMLATAKSGGTSGNALVTTEAMANAAWANFASGTLLGGVDGLITVDETAIVADTPLQVDIPGYHAAAPEHVGEPYLEVSVSELAAAAVVTTFDVMGASW